MINKVIAIIDRRVKDLEDMEVPAMGVSFQEIIDELNNMKKEIQEELGSPAEGDYRGVGTLDIDGLVERSDKIDYTNKASEILSKYAVKVDKETCPKLLQVLENLTNLIWAGGMRLTDFDPLCMYGYAETCIFCDPEFGTELNWLTWLGEGFCKLPEISFSEFMEKLKG